MREKYRYMALFFIDLRSYFFRAQKLKKKHKGIYYNLVKKRKTLFFLRFGCYFDFCSYQDDL